MKYKTLFIVHCIASITFFLAYRATPQTVLPILDSKQSTLSNNDSIIILPATVKFISKLTGDELEDEKYNHSGISEVMLIQSKKVLSKRNYKFSDKMASKYAFSEKERSLLLKSNIPKEILARIGSMNNLTGPYKILVSDIKVKVGNGGSWDPISGFFTSKNHYSRIRSRLINSESGEILWKNEVLLRDIPQVGKKNFDKILKLLYSTFSKSSSNENN